GGQPSVGWFRDVPWVVEDQRLQLRAHGDRLHLGGDDEQGARACHAGENARPLGPCQTRLPFLYYCAQVVSQLRTERDRLPHRDRTRPAKRQRVSLEPPNRRPYE